MNELQAAIKECQNGQSQAFGLIYDQYIRKIYNYLYFRTRHQQTAEDLTSLVFTKAFQKIGSFNETQGTFSAWIYRIAHNSLVDYYRTNKNTIDITQALEMGVIQNTGEDLDNSVQLQKVNKYLNQLQAEQRELVIMRVWDELPYSTISEITGKSAAALKMNLSRILNKLRKELVTVPS